MATKNQRENSIQPAKDVDEKIQDAISHQEAGLSDVVDSILVRKIDIQ